MINNTYAKFSKFVQIYLSCVFFDRNSWISTLKLLYIALERISIMGWMEGVEFQFEAFYICIDK